MNYIEAVKYIHSLLKFGIRPGLNGMDALLHFLGNPHKDLKYVHVAGTNGKGSTSTAISNVLIDAGITKYIKHTKAFMIIIFKKYDFSVTIFSQIVLIKSQNFIII